jgi:hypothetical protein
MRENQIDMWIVAMKEGHYDPLWELLGRGYVGNIGHCIFADRGADRIERAAMGITDHNRDACGAYDIDSTVALGSFVAKRKPRRIGLNMSEEMGLADGLWHTLYNHIVKQVGPQYASRLSSRRVASELVPFGEATEIGRRIAERALSKEIITPGLTTLRDVAWWIQDEQLGRGLGSSFEVPSIYVTRPNGIEATSNAGSFSAAIS